MQWVLYSAQMHTQLSFSTLFTHSTDIPITGYLFHEHPHFLGDVIPHSNGCSNCLPVQSCMWICITTTHSCIQYTVVTQLLMNQPPCQWCYRGVVGSSHVVELGCYFLIHRVTHLWNIYLQWISNTVLCITYAVFVTKLCIGNGKVTLTSLNYLISVNVSSSVLCNIVKFYCVWIFLGNS